MANVSSSVSRLPAMAYLPVTAATDLPGNRWSLPIIREILHGNENFNDICRALPGISRNLLAARLRSLSQRGLLRVALGRPSERPLPAHRSRGPPCVPFWRRWASGP